MFSPNKQLIIDSINGLCLALGTPTIPTWDEAGRPDPRKGLIGFNIENSEFEISDGNSWFEITTSGALEPGAVLFGSPNGTIKQDVVDFYWDDDIKQLQIGPTTGFAGNPQESLVVGNNYNNYTGIYVQNRNEGDSASTDIILGADNDSVSIAGHYLDLGIEGSNFSGITSDLGFVKTVSVNAGGSGYAANDVLTLLDGAEDCTVKVLTVNGSGAVLTVRVENNGEDYTVSSGVATSGGTGTGCTINILTLFDFSALTANSTYVWSSGGDLALVADDAAPNSIIRLIVGGTATANQVGTITPSGLTLTNLTSGKYVKASTNGLLDNGPTPLAGTKIYYVSDSSGGAVNRKLTFTDGILTAET